MSPAAGRVYNAAHRYWGPVAVMVVALPDAMPLGLFLIGLGWATHVALDRAIGVGRRDA